MGVKVVVDYTTGTYRVIGSRNGKVETISKPIRGVDEEDEYFKANFSRNLITRRKNEMKERLDELQNKYYDFKYSKKLLDKVDPMLYRVLKAWDEKSGTKYADEYLMTATEDLSNQKNPGEPKDFFEDECRKARQKSLDQAGIDLSYNVGLFNANKDLTFMDKIRGRRIARNQEDLFSRIDINDSLFLKPNYYLEDETDFINEEKYKNNIENTTKKTIDEAKNQQEINTDEIKKQVKEKENLSEEEINGLESKIGETTADMLKNMEDEVTRSNAQKNIKLDIEAQVEEAFKDRKGFDKKPKAPEIKFDIEPNPNASQKPKEEIKFNLPKAPSRKVPEEVKFDINPKKEAEKSQDKSYEKIKIDLEKNQEASQEANNSEDKVEIPVLHVEPKKQEEKPDIVINIGNNKSQEKQEPKRTIKKPYVPRGKKAKRYQNKDKKKRVRNHTGQRPGPTKRQRKSAELKEQRSKTFYEAQMERNERREKEKAAAKARYEEYLKQQENPNLSREAESKELEEIIRKSRELEISARADRLAAEKKLAEMRGIPFEEKEKEPEKANNEAPRRIQRTNSSKIERRIAAEKRYYKRKLRSPSESVRNMRYSNRSGEKRTLRLPDFSKIKRKVQAELRHWKRKIRDEKDSIRNKERRPLSQRAKRAILTGVISIAAASMVVTAVGVTGNKNNSRRLDDVAVTESVDKDAEKQDDNSNKKPTDQTHESDEEKDTTKQSETSTKKEENDSRKVTDNSSGAKENVSTENKTSETNTPNVQGEKTPEQIVQEFHEEAKRAYTNGVIIGQQPYGDLLDNQTYSENPEGTGKTGKFAEHPDFRVEFINIVTPEGWKTVRAEGKSLSDLLEENPDYITYNFHVVDGKTGGWLGFVTQQQYEKLIDEKANQIIQEKYGKTANQNQTQENDDLER